MDKPKIECRTCGSSEFIEPDNFGDFWCSACRRYTTPSKSQLKRIAVIEGKPLPTNWTGPLHEVVQPPAPEPERAERRAGEAIAALAIIEARAANAIGPGCNLGCADIAARYFAENDDAPERKEEKNG